MKPAKAGRLFCAVSALAASSAALASATENHYPDIPEPMVFDMIRPLGSAKGELETNVLVLAPLSGPHRGVEWAPEIEYAFADGYAIEFELPFVNSRLSELKLGLQAAFGTLNQGNSAHGVQYLGIYDRETREYSSTLAYMFGHRFSERVSTMSMVGIGDVRPGVAGAKPSLIVNQAAFLDTATSTVIGLEANYRRGEERSLLLMPQLHQRMSSKLNLQAGMGVSLERGAPARPTAGLRVIGEF